MLLAILFQNHGHKYGAECSELGNKLGNYFFFNKGNSAISFWLELEPLKFKRADWTLFDHIAFVVSMSNWVAYTLCHGRTKLYSLMTNGLWSQWTAYKLENYKSAYTLCLFSLLQVVLPNELHITWILQVWSSQLKVFLHCKLPSALVGVNSFGWSFGTGLIKAVAISFQNNCLGVVVQSVTEDFSTIPKHPGMDSA